MLLLLTLSQAQPTSTHASELIQSELVCETIVEQPEMQPMYEPISDVVFFDCNIFANNDDDYVCWYLFATSLVY